MIPKNTFKKKYWISPSMSDPAGNLSVGSLVDILQDMSIYQLENEAVLKKYFVQENVGMFLSARQIDILERPKYLDNIVATTWINDCTPSLGYRNSMVYDEDNNPLVVTSALGIFVDLEALQIIRMPDEVVDSIPTYDQYPMEYLNRRIRIPKKLSPIIMPNFAVRRSMLDFNRHVNNSEYVSEAAEYIPVDFDFNRIRVEFKHAARKENCFQPYLYQIPNGWIVDMRDSKGTQFAIVEFTKVDFQKSSLD